MATRENLLIWEVRNIRRFHADGYTIRRIQEAFGLAQRTVSDVVHHRTHKRVRPVGECSTEHPFDTMTLGDIQRAYQQEGYRGHGRDLTDQNQEALSAMSAR